MASHGFTLVELLVVIGIIGILIGLLLPLMARARKMAKGTVEVAASRQLMQAYLLYTNDNRGALIPGHLNDNYTLVDDLGVLLSPAEVTKRWPWRLGAHIKYGLRGSILVNERADTLLSNRNVTFWSYWVSLTPSFGLNLYNLGGDLTGGGVNNAPGWIRKITRATQTTRRIVFVSSCSPGDGGPVEGYFKIIPPTKSSEYSTTGWTTADYQDSGEPSAWGYVHPRYFNKAIVACLDGHSETLSMAELRDMTRWSEPAAQSGNANWIAPATTP